MKSYRNSLSSLIICLAAANASAAVVTGRVSSSADDAALAGVAVSDGLTVTVTDAEGRYTLETPKQTGYVFISTPAGYIAPCTGTRPQFFQYTTNDDADERHDFTLDPVDDSRHVIIFQADQHLADRVEDLEQFKTHVVPDFNSLVARYSGDGVPVYSISLGDTSWDNYWYDNKFPIGEAVKYTDMYACPVYMAMGNHDNDPYQTDDWQAELPYIAAAMPPYYSFNAGGIHYIIMDNIVYRNTGGEQGKKGKRDYDHAVSAAQMEWLRADLALIDDKETPIVICAHAPFYNTPSLEEDGTVTVKGYINNIDEFEQALAPFGNVNLYAGHVHRHSVGNAPSGMVQHTLPSLCGMFWWTRSPGYSSYHISPDGSPAGFGILEVSGRDMDYRYRGLECADDYQFRVYDLNNVCLNRKYLKRDEDLPRLKKVVGDYINKNKANELLVNVFAYGPGWTVEAWEDGRPIDPERVTDNDPLFILAYAIGRINHTDRGIPGMPVRKVNHLFKLKASSPQSTITVRATDPRGRASEQTITRPQAFPPEDI